MILLFVALFSGLAVLLVVTELHHARIGNTTWNWAKKLQARPWFNKVKW